MNQPPPLPEKFLERLRLILPASQYQDCVAAFCQPPATAFRVNPLKSESAALEAELRDEGFALEPLAWKDDAFVVPRDQRRALTECAACREGRLYIQNPASMVPPLVLDPQPGERILDLCAAPGSKTVQLAGLMCNQGQIAAVESVRPRFFRLRANLETCGATSVQTYLKDGTRVWKHCPEEFDRVLLDAPCSSEGRFNTSEPASYAYWSERKIREMQRKQRRLLFSAVQCLKPGGVLVYSTCAFAPEENEVVLHGLLEKFAGALRVEEVEVPGVSVQEGLEAWKDRPLHPDLRRAIRILPDGLMEGFFVCRLRTMETTLDAARSAPDGSPRR